MKNRTLDLGYTCVGDAGLAHLMGLKRLKLLHLGHTKVTDEGLGYLCGLTKLERLDLSGCQVTGTGLARLRNLRVLRVRLKVGYDRWESISDLVE